MNSKNLEIFCVTNKIVPHFENSNLNLAGVGDVKFSTAYLLSNTKYNIYAKEKHYSELVFHYWYWKNMMNLTDKNWIGFCQRRRVWVKNINMNQEINKKDLNKYLLKYPDPSWDGYESIICEPIKVNPMKKIKIIKRGWRSVLKNPLILFNTKEQNILLHFDMFHGYGNLKRAISQLEKEDRNDFYEYVNTREIFNPHIMYISKNEILDKWFNALFPWLERCEKIFGFENLKGYETRRLYAYLAERYASFWFKKYTKYKEHPWLFIDD